MADDTASIIRLVVDTFMPILSDETGGGRSLPSGDNCVFLRRAKGCLKKNKQKSLEFDELLLVHDAMGKTFSTLHIQVVGIQSVDVYQFSKFT